MTASFLVELDLFVHLAIVLDKVEGELAVGLLNLDFCRLRYTPTLALGLHSHRGGGKRRLFRYARNDTLSLTIPHQGGAKGCRFAHDICVCEESQQECQQDGHNP